MCTDEQWTPKNSTGTMMISKFWISLKGASGFNHHSDFSYWMTPLNVPPNVKDYKFSFPTPLSSPCVTHFPAKLK